MASLPISDFHETNENFDAGKHGKDYEIEISKFIFKRLIDNSFKNFKFTREKKGLGKFDDLAVIYETDEGLRKYSLVQLKHSNDESKKINYESLAQNKSNYFYLPKYFNHYVESLQSISNDPDFSNAQLDQLIICTNVGMEEDLGDIQKYKLNNEGILKNSGILYRLQISNDNKKKIFAENYVSDRKKLANELSTFIMLNKRIDINTLIKDDHVSLIKKYHVPLATGVIDVRGKKLKAEFLDDKLDDNLDLLLFRQTFFESVREFCENFKDLDCNDLKCKLKMSIKKAVDLKLQLSKYKSMDFVEFLKGLTINIKSGFGNTTLYPDYFKYLPSNETYTNKVDKRIDQFLNVLTLAVEQRNNENRIREELSPDIFIAYNDKMSHWYHSGSRKDSENDNIRKREWITKENLVSEAMNTIIKFQDTEIEMSRLVSNESLLDSDILMRVFCCKEISVGNDFHEFGHINKYYISRVLNRQRRLDKNVLKERNIDVLLLSNTEDNHINKDILELLPEEAKLYDIGNVKQETRFIYVEKGFHENDFTDFVDKYQEEFDWKNIHWLEIQGNELLWKKSFGSLSVSQKYFCDHYQNAEIISESDLCKDNQFIIIVGEPGMGKSTLFQHILEDITKISGQNENPIWIIKILLRDCIQVINNLDSVKDLNDVTEFLAQIAKEEGSFCRRALKHCLSNGRVILMLDGFDELHTGEHQNRITELLNYLQNKSKIKQIWITTRPHCRKILENCLGVVSFSIKEITEEQQISFLSGYWTHNSNKSDDHILRYTKILIQNFNAHIKDHERNFLGIPLQTYMFAVVFLQEIIKDEPVIQDILPITSLFKQFLRTKYDIYLKKCGQLTLSEDIKELLMHSLDEVHQNFALSYGELLSADDAQAFMFKRSSPLTDDRLLDIGIVYKLNDTFHFLHKTFSEYLIAKRMVDIVIYMNKNEINYYGNILENLISNHESKFLLYLFDTELTELFPLHKAVLKGDEEKVKSLEISEVDIRDCLGRTLAYYAVQYRHFTIMKMLLHMQGFSGKNDNFLIKSLIVYVKDSYISNLDNVYRNAKLFTLLFKFAPHYSLNLFDAFDLHFEMKANSWPLVRQLLMIRRSTGEFGDSLYYLESALKCKAPADIVIMILDNIRLNPKPLDPSLMAYSNFMKYLLVCELHAVEGLLQKYKISFQNEFRKIPIFVGVYEYFNLRNIPFGNSLSSLLSSLRERANLYTAIVRLLLENGASYIILRDDDVNDIFSCTKYNIKYIKQPIMKFFEDHFISELNFIDFPLVTLKTEAEAQSTKNPTSFASEAIREFWSVLEDYAKDIPLDMNQTVKEAVIIIAVYILKSSDAGKLLQLTFKFYKAVETNKYGLVSKCLKEAKQFGWTKALLNATGRNFNVAEDLAKANFHFRIYVLLRKHRVGTR